MKSSAMLLATLLSIALLLVGGNGVPISNQAAAEFAASHLSAVSDPSALPQRKARAKKPAKSQVLFDDFNYSTHKELLRHGWIIRTADGWPGVPGATWRKQGVSFIKDLEHPGNRVLRMT